MNQELIINTSPNGVELALLEDGLLVELHQDKHDKDFAVGDIYLGKVKKVVPGLNAAFVDIGFQKDAFLHYTDLGPQVRSLKNFVENIRQQKINSASFSKLLKEPDIVKTGKMEEVLNKRDILMVQVLKEPIASKGPRLICEVTLAGKYVVLAPFGEIVAISRKIKNADERDRLKRLIEGVCPPNFGVIVRTAAEGKKLAEIHQDIKNQLERWKRITQEVQFAEVPDKLLSDANRSASILRDFMNIPFDSIAVNDKEMSDDLKEYLKENDVQKAKVVNYYNKRAQIFDYYKINKQIKSAFGKTVNMPSGAYLVVEHTEAMHVIDVNSGHKMSMGGSQESNALTVNLEAVNEIARQVRLRDLGGLLIIDFIDMKDPDNKKMVARRMAEAMANDRAQHTILPLSKFCLMQITRARTRPEVQISTEEDCPSCKGTGKVQATILLLDDIENNLSYLLNEMNYSNLRLILHPYIEAYVKKGVISIQWKWFWKYKKWLQVTSEENYNLTEYRFLDAREEEIKI